MIVNHYVTDFLDPQEEQPVFLTTNIFKYSIYLSKIFHYIHHIKYLGRNYLYLLSIQLLLISSSLSQGDLDEENELVLITLYIRSNIYRNLGINLRSPLSDR